MRLFYTKFLEIKNPRKIDIINYSNLNMYYIKVLR